MLRRSMINALKLFRNVLRTHFSPPLLLAGRHQNLGPLAMI